MRRPVSLSIIVLASSTLGAQGTPRSSFSVTRPPAAMAAIRQADLQRDLHALAGDAMRGREAGTVDEMRASMWLADEMRKIGLSPRGEDGSWFQWWNMRRSRISNASTVTIAGRKLELWTEVAPTSNAAAEVAGPSVFVGDGSDSTTDIRGKVAIATLVAPNASSVRTTTNTYEVNYLAPRSRRRMRASPAAAPRR